MDFSLLKNRKIIDVLIGDIVLYGDFGMPYLSGPQLCQLSTEFGLPVVYSWKGPNKSRWEYMQDLLHFLNVNGRVPDLLSHLFLKKRFDNLTNLGSPKNVDEAYKAIVSSALNAINAHLSLVGKELRIIGKIFVIVNTGEDVAVDTPNVSVITSQYIKELPDRIKLDLDNKDYDSVITKSRTLLEEVLIFIIEHMKTDGYNSKGDLVRIYQDVTDLLNMRQKNVWDTRVNELLGGLHKLVSAISSMRNINSDAHGAGSARIQIRKSEALLAANSAMILAEYWLSVYERRREEKNRLLM